MPCAWSHWAESAHRHEAAQPPRPFPARRGVDSRLFAASERSGQAIAMLLSLIETPEANGLNPRTWLVDPLTMLPNWPKKAG